MNWFKKARNITNEKLNWDEAHQELLDELGREPVSDEIMRRMLEDIEMVPQEPKIKPHLISI